MLDSLTILLLLSFLGGVTATASANSKPIAFEGQGESDVFMINPARFHVGKVRGLNQKYGYPALFSADETLLHPRAYTEPDIVY